MADASPDNPNATTTPSTSGRGTRLGFLALGLVVLAVALVLGKAILVDRHRIDTADAHRRHGDELYAKESFDEAIAAFTAAIDMNPNDARAYNNRGMARDLQRDAAGALTDYAKAIELDPQRFAPYMNRGCLLLHEGRNEEVLADAARVIDIASDKYFGYWLRGLAELRIGRLADAQRDFDECIRLEPDLRPVVAVRERFTRHAERASDLHVRLLVDVAPDTADEQGARHDGSRIVSILALAPI